MCDAPKEKAPDQFMKFLVNHGVTFFLLFAIAVHLTFLVYHRSTEDTEEKSYFFLYREMPIDERSLIPSGAADPQDKTGFRSFLFVLGGSVVIIVFWPSMLQDIY